MSTAFERLMLFGNWPGSCKTFALINLLFFSCFSLWSQKVERPTVFPIYLQSASIPSEYYQPVLEQTDYPPFFNTYFLDPRAIRDADHSQYLSFDQYPAYINSHDFGRQMISAWFDRNAEGGFSTETLEKYALLSADDASMKFQSSSARGIGFITEQGEPLIENSFLMLAGPSSIVSAKEMYDVIDAGGSNASTYKKLLGAYGSTPVKRKKQGTAVLMRAALYRLDWDEETLIDFYNRYWTDGSDQEKVAAFERANFPLIKVREEVFYGSFFEKSKTQNHYKRHDIAAISNGMEEAMEHLSEQVKAFDFEAPLFQTDPIRAKLGVKQNLKPGERFKVYEYVERNGRRVKKKKGVLTSTGDMDRNTGLSTGNSRGSRFITMTGGGFEPGMELKKIKMAHVRIDLASLIGDHYLLGGRFYYHASPGMEDYQSVQNYNIYYGGGIFVGQSYFENGDTALTGSAVRYEGLLNKNWMLFSRLSLDATLGIAYTEHSMEDYEVTDSIFGDTYGSLSDLGADLGYNYVSIPIELGFSYYFHHAVRLHLGVSADAYFGASATGTYSDLGSEDEVLTFVSNMTPIYLNTSLIFDL